MGFWCSLCFSEHKKWKPKLYFVYVSDSKLYFVYEIKFSGVFHELKIFALQVNVVTMLTRYNRYPLAIFFISFN